MSYIKEELESMLIEHPKNEAKLTEIDLKLDDYNTRLDYAGTVYQDTAEEVIENMQLSSNNYDELHSNTNKISDKTANTAMNYHKEEYHINREDRIFLQAKIKEFEKIKSELDKKIVRVENMLKQLSEDEEFVVRKYYMKKSKWNYVEKAYFDNFETHKSIKQLQAYRDKALDSMLDIINTGER